MVVVYHLGAALTMLTNAARVRILCSLMSGNTCDLRNQPSVQSEDRVVVVVVKTGHISIHTSRAVDSDRPLLAVLLLKVEKEAQVAYEPSLVDPASDQAVVATAA